MGIISDTLQDRYLLLIEHFSETHLATDTSEISDPNYIYSYRALSSTIDILQLAKTIEKAFSRRLVCWKFKKSRKETNCNHCTPPDQYDQTSMIIHINATRDASLYSEI